MYRSQFILGPSFAPGFASWQRLRIGKKMCITAHPALSLCHRNAGAYALTLIGYCLSPNRPADDDEAIVEHLLDGWMNGADIVASTEELGGRWILVASGPSGTILFHDAGGLRQAYHTDGPIDGGVWCASQPPLLAKFLQVSVDSEAEAFMNSADFRNMGGGSWWPGSGSMWSGVRRLLPNHLVDLESGKARRYWPDQPVGRTTIDHAVTIGSSLLKGLVQSAALRFDLELLITAGWDSRLLLSASHEVRSQISYVSLVTPEGPESDAVIPAELLKRLGLEHTIERSAPEPSAAYWDEYSQNAMLAHRSYASNAEVLDRRLKREKVAITGHMGEIVKGFYKLAPLHANRLPPETMARLTGLGDNSYAREAFGEWRNQVNAMHDVHILDLFYWEQRVGSWLPTWLLEYDWSWQDCFVPMNCRRFLTEMLAVPRRHRRPPVVELYRRLILALWPDVLSSPIGKQQVPMHPASPIEVITRDTRVLARDVRDNTRYILGLRSNPSGS